MFETSSRILKYLILGAMFTAPVLADTTAQLIFRDSNNYFYGVLSVNDCFALKLIDYFNQNLGSNWTVVNNTEQSIWNMDVMDYHKIGPEPSFFLFGMPNQNAQRYLGTFSANASSQAVLLSLFQQANEAVPAEPARNHDLFLLTNKIFYGAALLLISFLIYEDFGFRIQAGQEPWWCVWFRNLSTLQKPIVSFLYAYYVDQLEKKFEKSYTQTPSRLDDFNGNKVALKSVRVSTQLAVLISMVDLAIASRITWISHQGFRAQELLSVHAVSFLGHFMLTMSSMATINKVCLEDACAHTEAVSYLGAQMIVSSVLVLFNFFIQQN